MQTYRISSSLSRFHRIVIVAGFVLAALPWSVGSDQSVFSQTIALEDSSKSPSAKKPTKSKSTVKSSSGSASGFGIMSSGGASQGGYTFNSNAKATASVGSDENVDEDEDKSPNSSPSASRSPQASTKASSKTTRTSSSRSTSMSVSREVNEDGDTIKVTVQEPTRQILLSQSSDVGIEVRIIPTRKTGSAKEVHVTAEDAEHLKKKDAKAYAAYRKYLLPQLKGDGSSVTSIAVQGGGDANDAEGNPAQQMMRKQLEEMLKNDALDPAVRDQIEGLIKKLPKQD